MTTAAAAGWPVGSACVFVGTQGSGADKGVIASRLDGATGALTMPRLAAELPRPTWVLADPTDRRLFVASDPRDAALPRVVVYAVERATGALRRLGDADPGGRGPTHLAYDAPSRTLYVADYGSGQLAALPVPRDGRLAVATSLVSDTGSGPSPRQTSPHAHAAVVAPGGRFVLVPDLGADRVFTYRIDPRSRLLDPVPVQATALPPGAGPRHLVFEPAGHHAYLITELSAELRAYDFDRRTGSLTERQVVPINAPGFSGTRSGAEVAIASDGRHLYASDRGENIIVVYATDPRNGWLKEMQRVASGGRAPWSLALDPSGRWLVVANQASDDVVAFAVAPRSGLLTAEPASRMAVEKPTSIAFLSGCP